MINIRNKKTGEIVRWQHGPSYRLGKTYNSLKEFFEDWEDAPKEKPKRYRLKRVLPTFKAGEMFHLSDFGDLWQDDGEEVMAYSHRTLEKFPSILTEWFEEVKYSKKEYKLTTINQIVEAILGDSDFDEPERKKLANEATIWLKTAMLCEDVGIDNAMEYFNSWHSDDEYREFQTEVTR